VAAALPVARKKSSVRQASKEGWGGGWFHKLPVDKSCLACKGVAHV
jgi:hypothetical protein